MPGAGCISGRWVVFSGIVWLVMAGLVCFKDFLEPLVGQDAAPYFLVVTIAGTNFVAMVLYDRIPNRFIVPVGLAGWGLTTLLLCWFFWFGPAALKP